MTEPSVIGSVADLREGQVLLPGFVSRRDDGLYIDLLAIDSRSLITPFIERVFASGARFTDLDYGLFLKLLFLWEPADIDRQLEELKQRNQAPQLRLARDIVVFPAERRDIYRGVKVLDGGKGAEYVFEQISVEREIADPAASDGSGKRMVAERLYADFDEFVAALWEKGVRFGIDAKAVRDAIARDKAERMTIAQSVAPNEGRDASVDEQTDLLHRDNAPRLLPNGRMDLNIYRNRFPQVNKGTRLFKKVSRVSGVSGWDVTGRELPPVPIKDFDIQTLAGPGTQVVKDAGGECVVAMADGFLNIDGQSGQISVIDKIVSREGVSMRTTGDLQLAGDEYEEHGEVQEKRSINGHHMTFFADVYGNITSNGGRVTLKRNVSGGTVQSSGGNVFVEGGASRSSLQASGGSVTANHAETCAIVADKVRIGRAVRCDIVANEVEIENCEGCAIAAKQITIKTSTTRKDEATAVTLLLPDMTRFDRDRKMLLESCVEIEAQIAKHMAALQVLTAQPDMKSYLTIQPKIKAKTIVMSAAQQVQWQGLMARIAPTLRQLGTLNGAIQNFRRGIADAEGEIEALAEARRTAAQGLFCNIESVLGDTLVHTLRQSSEHKPLASLPAKELHKRLREPGDGSPRLFFGSSGSFAWQPPLEEEPSSDDSSGAPPKSTGAD